MKPGFLLAISILWDLKSCISEEDSEQKLVEVSVEGTESWLTSSLEKWCLFIMKK